MREAGNSTYELGRAAFAKGITKFSDDDRLMLSLQELSETVSGFRTLKAAKQNEVAEWKKGWREAKEDAEAPKEVVAPKKKKKKKKVAKKKTK